MCRITKYTSDNLKILIYKVISRVICISNFDKFLNSKHQLVKLHIHISLIL